MLKQLTFNEDFRNFTAGYNITFRPGVNLLVGDQGTGKSTILQALASLAQIKAYQYPLGLAKKVSVDVTPCEVKAWDFEKNNRRTLGYLDYDKLGLQLAAKFTSHGEANLDVLQALEKAKQLVFLTDEPDMALSIRSIFKLISLFTKAASQGCQIIAAVHHPFLIEAWKEVYSCEHDTWMTSEDFIRSQVNEN
jgi:predicted ATPase